MRYVGQEHAVTVDLPGGVLRARDVAGIKAAGADCMPKKN